MSVDFFQDELMVMSPRSAGSGKSAYDYAVEGGYTGTEEEFAIKLAALLNEGITATVDKSSNSITIAGDLGAGTYTAYYEMEDAEGKKSLVEIGKLELVGEDSSDTESQPVTETIPLTENMSMTVGTGEDRITDAYSATPHVDVSKLPKPCTIRLTGAKWSFESTDETGYIRFYITDTSGNKLASNYTHPDCMPAGVSMVLNGGSPQDVSVKVTSDSVGTLRFAGANLPNPENQAEYLVPEATLTYTPAF